MFAAGVWLVSLALRNNRAALRYSLWLAASATLLVPFSMVAPLGASFGGLLAFRTAAAEAPRWTFTLIDLAQPFALPPQHPASAAGPSLLPTILFGVWIAGCAASLAASGRSWLRVRSVVRSSVRLAIDAAIPVLSSGAASNPV